MHSNSHVTKRFAGLETRCLKERRSIFDDPSPRDGAAFFDAVCPTLWLADNYTSRFDIGAGPWGDT